MAAPTKSHGRISISASRKPRALLQDTPDIAGAWKAKVLTLYPEMFPGVLGHSLTGTALKDGLWALEALDIRRYGRGKHRNVDDTPAGGGAGMVLRADVVAEALDAAQTPYSSTDWPVIYLSPRGKPFNQAIAQRLSRAKGITLLCGRFEGVDQRVLDAREVEEISMGDFILTGGEIAAQALIDACVRLIPRVLGNQESFENESFSDGLLEHPHYTRPTIWEGRTIPDILLSGHHANIAAWRSAQSESLTKERRPDLWRAHIADSVEDQQLSDAHNNRRKDEQKDD
ncbi:MAG: tRNA (guanosine(37)-N1)-methyltransferase TrmD [Rhodobacteraceae bacterium]|nr:tRNA (guanosine(37)-N1)-methyltransferase TrmD [Paracoccaceae bacterium]